MNIVILDADTLGADVDLDPIRQLGRLTVHGRTAPEQTVVRAAGMDVVVTNKVVLDAAVMDSLPGLKLICVAATGMNNIDLEAAKARGVAVRNVAGYSTESVVQVTLSHVMYLLNRHGYYNDFAWSRWVGSGLFTHMGPPFFELAGKRWGIIGLGTIGRRVAEVARAFGCEVAYHSTSGRNNTSDYPRLELDELLSTSHVITIHAPLNERTANLITYGKLGLIRDGGIIVNVGRGGIVNETDLARALDERPIYAGLDVVTREPIDGDSPLLKVVNKERLSMTPHIAWASIEARKRLVDGIAGNIRDFVRKGST